MMLAIVAIVIGLLLLVWSSDRFVDGATALACNLGVSRLVVGLTVVGFGTSAPEMLVAGIASFDQNPNLGVGNAIGSNIANIALIVGFTALLIPLGISSRIVKFELPLLLGLTLFAGLIILDGDLSRLDGMLLMSALALMLFWLVNDALNNKSHDVMAEEIREEVSTDMSLKQAVFWFLVGLIVLLISARMLVWGAVSIAQMMGVSDLVIGLTIVAIGTSLPELAASIAGVRRDESDLVIGNVIGSNMFNMLAVMAIPGLIAPGGLPKDVLDRDFPLMLGLTVLFLLFAFSIRSQSRLINRYKGGVLLSIFIAYQVFLFWGVSQGAM